MGKPPKVPKPPPLPKPATPVDPAVKKQEAEFRTRMANASNRRSTLLTSGGGQGVEAMDSQLQRKTLLGQ